ncbi:Ovostatin-like protein, partial [Leptotrombidium deliense]
EPNLLRIWKSYLALNYNEFLNYSLIGRTEKSVVINTLQKAHKHQIAFRKPDAYSLKSLAMIKKYIYVDFQALNETLEWILKLQDHHTGCWTPIGPNINHHLRNNETGQSLITSFVIIALLESQKWLNSPSNDVIESAFKCLQSTTKQHDAYTLVLSAHVHSLANKTEEANQYLIKLQQLATNDTVNNVTYWEQQVPGEEWISKSTSIQF